MRRNPFDSAYMTEDIDENRYPDIFSTLLVPETSALFKRGNTVLVGTQGSGKTMLLNLLKPEIRFRYYKLECDTRDSRFTFLPDQLGEPFIGCGIHISKRAVVEFGQRPILDSDFEVSVEEYNVYFADFLNYLLVEDLLKSTYLHTTASSPNTRKSFQRAYERALRATGLMRSLQAILAAIVGSGEWIRVRV